MAEKTKLDPITFEILRHRLEEIVAESYYTLARVSGNAVITEAGDHEESIMNAMGDTVMVGGGIVEWTGCLEDAARYISQEYEDNPGIHEGDQFIMNDTGIAAVHHMDIQVLKPVFWEGKRVAWLNCAGHMMDVGGMQESGFMFGATERIQEGLCMKGVKICEKGRIRRDIEDTLKYMTRQPDLFMLEIGARIAANNAAETRLLQTIEEFGIDKVLAIFEELPDYSEKLIRAKLRSLPDGVFKATHHFESIREDEGYLTVKCALIKQGDSITLDFTGSSPQSKGSQNVALPGARSNAECPFLIMLGYDIPWNYGLWRIINWVLPEGSIVNPSPLAPVSTNTPAGTGYVMIGTVTDCISQMYLCSDRKEEAFGNGGNAFHNPNMYGTGKRGEFFITMMMELMISGGGALAYRDGDNTCSNLWTTKPQVTNIERAEEHFPWLYLWRKEAMDTGGPGKYRGGTGCTNAIISYGIGEMGVHDMGLGMEPRLANGLAGGYPAPNVKQIVYRGANLKEMFKNGQLPRTPDDIPGHREVKPLLHSFTLNPEDAYVIYFGGGGGYGDPLQRDPEAVLKDIHEEYVSFEEGKRTYGVIGDPALQQVNWEETRKLRQGMIQERLTLGKRE